MSLARELFRDARFALGLLGRKPFSALIQVTNRCNMTCDFCDFWPNGAPPSQELSLDDFRALEEQLAGLGTFLISIEGGEPFVRPDIIELVRILCRRHIGVLYTNGWFIDEDKARALFAAGLSQVGVSIDFPEAARHDAKRGLEDTTARAWRAVELLREAAPYGERQVHVMTVYMEENRESFPELLEQSKARGVGHAITLLATKGTRRAQGGSWPEAGVGAELKALWKRYPHFRVFRRYLDLIDPFLEERGAMPRCRAGAQSFNIDHVGNVAPCIEKIGEPVGNVRESPLRDLVEKMKAREDIAGCQDCWTLCRGVSQTLSGGGSLGAWLDLGGRMRSR